MRKNMKQQWRKKRQNAIQQLFNKSNKYKNDCKLREKLGGEVVV
jgi:hypothetical protein